MLDPGLLTCSKPALFLNLIYKSLKADVVLRRVRAFIKRLLQVVCGQMPPFVCGALFLVSEILKAKPALRSQLDRAVRLGLLGFTAGLWGSRFHGAAQAVFRRQ